MHTLLVTFEPFLLIGAGIWLYAGGELGPQLYPTLALAFAIRGFWLRSFFRRRWLRNIDAARLNSDVRHIYFSPYIHWTRKLIILQERTGFFTQTTAYAHLTLAVLCVVIWIVATRN